MPRGSTILPTESGLHANKLETADVERVLDTPQPLSERCSAVSSENTGAESNKVEKRFTEDLRATEESVIIDIEGENEMVSIKEKPHLKKIVIRELQEIQDWCKVNQRKFDDAIIRELINDQWLEAYEELYQDKSDQK